MIITNWGEVFALGVVTIGSVGTMSFMAGFNVASGNNRPAVWMAAGGAFCAFAAPIVLFAMPR